jgi:hypothetical protein
MCKELILLDNKTYHSLIARPNNKVDAQRKKDLITCIEDILDDIVDLQTSHIVCDVCHRRTVAIQKAEK